MPDQPRRVRALLDDIDRQNAARVPDAAALLLTALKDDGIVFVAGAGHSLAMVLETFYRAGGLAPVRPIWEPDVMPLSGALQSTRIERREGIGRSVMAAAAPAPPDIAVVFSTSGSNPYPVEAAQECQARGVPVIAVTSERASRGAAARTDTALADHGTVVLDTCAPPGDVVQPAEQPRTAAVSTILASYLWSLLLAELDEQARAQGVELPRWTSANVPGGDEMNARLLTRYAGRIPELTTNG